jgi:cytochrome c biogenesis protein CcdA
VDVGLALYDLQIWAKELVDTQLTHLTPVSGAVLYGAGLLTSLSPCALSLVPLTMAYLTDDGTDPSRNQKTLLFRAGMFTVGLATSLSVLGLSATLAGKLFGSAGAGALGAALPLTASVVAIVMGLNLLDLINLKLPSFEATMQLDRFPPSLQAFLLGATSALIASPCSTPVLASILGFVAASGEPYLGAGLLFSYSLGYSTPLLLAGVLSGAVTSFIAKRGDGFSWVTPATAAMLISYGTYSSLSTLFPPL